MQLVLETVISDLQLRIPYPTSFCTEGIKDMS